MIVPWPPSRGISGLIRIMTDDVLQSADHRKSPRNPFYLAIGVLEEQEYSADINLDGIVDESDLELLESALQSRFGQADWIARCDLAEPKDQVIDEADKDVLLSQWLKVEKWRNKE